MSTAMGFAEIMNTPLELYTQAERASSNNYFAQSFQAGTAWRDSNGDSNRESSHGRSNGSSRNSNRDSGTAQAPAIGLSRVQKCEVI